MTSGLPICHHCKQPISREYMFALDVYWHPDHFLCQRCRRRIDEAAFVEEGGKIYHTACIALKCTCCGQLCVGHYKKDLDDLAYCDACSKRTKSCVHCGRYICPGQAGCRVCASSAIVSEADARGQFASALDWVRKQGVPIRQNVDDIRLKLVRAETLSKKPGGLRHVGETKVGFIEFLGVRRYNVSVTMAVPMPRMLFHGVAAHELGHVWMMTEGITKLSPRETEGFCELLAYLYYQSEGSAESKRHSAAMHTNPDPIYGKGFQDVYRLHGKYGLARIVNDLASQGRLPPG